jgi:hypothetical protein
VTKVLAGALIKAVRAVRNEKPQANLERENGFVSKFLGRFISPAARAAAAEWAMGVTFIVIAAVAIAIVVENAVQNWF